MVQRANQLSTAWKEWLSLDGSKLLLYARQRTNNLQDAEDLLHYGESPTVEGVDQVQLAALATVANVILNLDEVLQR